MLSEDVEEKIKAVAEMSMGTEITEQDITNICYLCDQVRIYANLAYIRLSSCIRITTSLNV